MVFESGLIYDSNAEEDHLPMILIADVEIPRSASVVAAPISSLMSPEPGIRKRCSIRKCK